MAAARQLERPAGSSVEVKRRLTAAVKRRSTGVRRCALASRTRFLMCRLVCACCAAASSQVEWCCAALDSAARLSPPDARRSESDRSTRLVTHLLTRTPGDSTSRTQLECSGVQSVARLLLGGGAEWLRLRESSVCCLPCCSTSQWAAAPLALVFVDSSVLVWCAGVWLQCARLKREQQRSKAAAGSLLAFCRRRSFFLSTGPTGNQQRNESKPHSSDSHCTTSRCANTRHSQRTGSEQAQPHPPTRLAWPHICRCAPASRASLPLLLL